MRLIKFAVYEQQECDCVPVDIFNPEPIYRASVRHDDDKYAYMIMLTQFANSEAGAPYAADIAVGIIPDSIYIECV